MKRVLVLGDGMRDEYRHFMATRICPEAPVQVLVKTKEAYSTAGGAGLVVDQLRALFENFVTITFLPGSHSVKERIFADDRLMLRIDSDSENPVVPAYIFQLENKLEGYDAIIVSDYDKGAFIEPTANWLMIKANELKIPVFVDAKKNWHWYRGAFAMFPNDRENSAGINAYAKHVIHKCGPEGCRVDGVHIPTKNHAVRDVCGAGDVFLAAFVYEYLMSNDNPAMESELLQSCARFANKVAGISVEFVGTHIVTKKELDERPD